MVKYVNSWYLTKLNTDNYEVLMLIYQVLMDFVKNLSNRINKTLKSEVELFNIVDELSSVINNHLLDLASEDSQYDLKIFADYYKEANTRNSFKQTPQADLETILDEYLCSNHVLFELKDDPLMYFRVLVKNLLEIIYSNDSAVNPLSSTIITNLVVVIVGDLVLALVLEKLSSPEFILKDIISNVVDIITATLDEKKVAKEESDEVTLSYYERFQLVITMCYSKVSKFVLTAKSEGLPLSNTVSENESNEINVDVFENSIFKLMDTITNFSFRKPLVSNFISFIMGSLRLNSWIYYKLSSLSSSFVMKKLISAPFLGEEGLSNIISSLRLSLFYRDNNQPSTESLDEELDTLTLDQLTDSIFNLINEKIPGAFANSYIQGKSPILSLTNENETDLKHRIRRMLIIFNYQISNTNNNNEFNETCELNKLLMIKLIDCIVRNLYPELV
ncbi:hypothetical protein DFJ63DRAFT_312482 [Scheffersomyces coipomensis]|uniref:uncharacterized protein n=1 Tax=Scheffersomyces coipomensis TaxID=1788519 RepID=UPI00315CD2C1